MNTKLHRAIIKTVLRRVPELKPHLSPAVLTILEGLYKSSLKAKGDLSEINAQYHDEITAALTDYFEGGAVGPSRTAFKQATIQAFSDAFDTGWLDGGAELPVDADALDWIETRLNDEMGYIDGLFEQAKELRRDKGFDWFAWVTSRADAYTRTLREIYNQARLMVTTNVMVTFTGPSGKESCKDCQRLHGQRHRLSWFIERDVVPPAGGNLECAPGRNCEHYLKKDNGEIITL